MTEELYAKWKKEYEEQLEYYKKNWGDIQNQIESLRCRQLKLEERIKEVEEAIKDLEEDDNEHKD